jgi:hypothetical protein
LSLNDYAWPYFLLMVYQQFARSGVMVTGGVILSRLPRRPFSRRLALPFWSAR